MTAVLAPAAAAVPAPPASDWRRRPWLAWFLSSLTCGVYGLWWAARLSRDLADADPRTPPRSARAVLAYSLGALLVVPLVVHLVGTARRVRVAQVLRSQAPDCSTWLVVVLALLWCLHIPYLQRRVNALVGA